ncbi:hypothetical protein AN964_11540 [Heyndrickxia shackletonii]|uniref:Uncharacterized protein n=1 Tax=Heyndrickxia shackletonii TaxID=157838 RepID=A0A0Q3WX30_9BACI|nr:hypothetical protein [Heyndrickxia shackletonii]KQL54067.1 hypothetical protein AN964_11540 [Heyndrickxia shackletonii]NEY99386.1 hypothetical protein [Heyndrickxia shackletonii]
MINKYENNVLEWIKNHFDMSAIVVEDFNVLPYGKRILDMEGNEMTVFYDFWTGNVKELFPHEIA